MAPTPSLDAIDATRCPLCGSANLCAMEVERATGEKQPPCWCTQVDFSVGLLERVPAPARGKACICSACAQGAQADGAPSSLALRKPTVP